MDIAGLYSTPPRLLQPDLLLGLTRLPPGEPIRIFLEEYAFGEIEANTAINRLCPPRSKINPPDGERILHEAASAANRQRVYVDPFHILHALNRTNNDRTYMGLLLDTYVVRKTELERNINEAIERYVKKVEEPEIIIDQSSVLENMDFVYEMCVKEGASKPTLALIAKRIASLKDQLLNLPPDPTSSSQLYQSYTSSNLPQWQ